MKIQLKIHLEYKIQENEEHFRSLNLIDISIKKIHE